MLKLCRVALHEWEFAYPDEYYDLREEFNHGCESYEEGNLDEAERVFRGVLAELPFHLDAIHHLAIVLSERDLVDQARDLWISLSVSVARHFLKISSKAETSYNGDGWRTGPSFDAFMDWLCLNARKG